MRSPGAILLDEHLDLVRRLSSHAQPILDPLAVELGPGVYVGNDWIIGTQLLQHATVPRGAAVHGANAIERAVPPSQLLHANTYCHVIFLLLPRVLSGLALPLSGL